MVELINKIKNNRIPKEVLFLMDILNNEDSVKKCLETHNTVEFKYINFPLFSINSEFKKIRPNHWNIMVSLDIITERNKHINYTSADYKNIKIAIELSDNFSDYTLL